MFDPKIYRWSDLDTTAKSKLCLRPSQTLGAQTDQVLKIIDRVRTFGDKALFELTETFDGVAIRSLMCSKQEIREAYKEVDQAAIDAIKGARANIESFHRHQIPESKRVDTMPGVHCWREHRPIERVGLYIPGGSAPLVSTVMMLGVPARIANCPVRVLITPPQKDGSINPHILVAADLCGIDLVFKAGGAQAIAAMAYGTSTIPKVDKIFGPGNTWVTVAKQLVAQEPLGAACDMPAGPSEVLIIADANADAALIAIDLLSQAEHGADSQVVLISTSEALISSVIKLIPELLNQLPRAALAIEALKGSLFISVDHLDDALAFSNLYAPEHLILQVSNPEDLCPMIQHAGSVFLGPWTPESAGDYASGTNHVLPTYGWAKSLSGIGVESFLKSISFQKLTPKGLNDLGPTIETLANIEGLEAHRLAVSMRLNKIGQLP